MEEKQEKMVEKIKNKAGEGAEKLEKIVEKKREKC